MEVKIVPSQVKSIEGREVTGIFAVHGVIDYVTDRSHPGSFSKTLREQKISSIKYLWSHNMDIGAAGPPVAVITGLKEIGRDELPGELLERYPEATGGVEVKRKYLNTPRGEEIYQGILEGAIDQQSYGYDPKKVAYTDVDNLKVRELHEVKLYEVSDVLWGANPATVASKIFTQSPEGLLQSLKAILEALDLEQKAGARHSSTDTKLLNSIHKAVIELGCTDCKGLISADEAGAEEDSTGKKDTEGPEEGKAGALPPLYLAQKAIEILSLG